MLYNKYNNTYTPLIFIRLTRIIDLSILFSLFSNAKLFSLYRENDIINIYYNQIIFTNIHNLV